MQHNKCKTCKAGGGRAGTLLDDECWPCRETRRQQMVVVHSGYPRTCKEIARMAELLTEVPDAKA